MRSIDLHQYLVAKRLVASSLVLIATLAGEVGCQKHRKRPQASASVPAAELLPAVRSDDAGPASFEWDSMTSGPRASKKEFVELESDVEGGAVFVEKGTAQIGSGLALQLTGGGIVYGRAVLEEQKVEFGDSLFFKYPVRDGETYDMIGFLKEFTDRDAFHFPDHDPPDLESLPVRVSHEKIRTNSGEVEAWIYRAAWNSTKEGTYEIEWTWVPGKGIVRYRNFDRLGENGAALGFEWPDGAGAPARTLPDDSPMRERLP